jgi:hypothetical protein
MASGSSRQVLGEIGFHPFLSSSARSTTTCSGLRELHSERRHCRRHRDRQLHARGVEQRRLGRRHRGAGRRGGRNRDELRLHFIESVPTLGTGKVDLHAVQRLATDFGGAAIS